MRTYKDKSIFALTSSESSLTDRLANHWRVALPLVLRPGEEVILALELDLNQQLQFSSGLVCLTNLGLIAFDNQHDLSTAQDSSSWSYWNFADDLKLHLHDHAGVASLELFNQDGRLALWRFTLAQNPVANRLLQQYKIEFAKSMGHELDNGLDQSQPLCPSCCLLYTSPSPRDS